MRGIRIVRQQVGYLFVNYFCFSVHQYRSVLRPIYRQMECLFGASVRAASVWREGNLAKSTVASSTESVGIKPFLDASTAVAAFLLSKNAVGRHFRPHSRLQTSH